MPSKTNSSQSNENKDEVISMQRKSHTVKRQSTAMQHNVLARPHS